MARLDVNQTFDVKRLILNNVEIRIDFGEVTPMDGGNLEYIDQLNVRHE